jgi:putative ABC transport system permease protein
MLERFERFGANRMGVWLNRWSVSNVPASEEWTLEDVDAIRENCSAIEMAVPTIGIRSSVRSGTTTLADQNILGTEPDYFQISNFVFVQGQSFTIEDNVMRERVCVLGSQTKYDLFYEANPIDQFILISGKRFRVVGYLEEKGGNRWMNADSTVIIPYLTGAERLGMDRVDEITMQVRDTSLADLASRQVRETLRARHPRIPQPEGETDEEKERNDPIDIWNVAERVAEREQTAKSMQRFLVVMGALSLFIGGVGVMNIMLVTVQERTREIGLRKAVGASRSAILSQFLIEAVFVCLAGGAIGTFSAVVACKYMAKLPDEAQIPDPVLTPEAILVAVIVTVGVGLFFGVYPATRASALEPISALRHE